MLTIRWQEIEPFVACSWEFQDQLRQHWKSDTFPECIREMYRSTSKSHFAMRRVVVVIRIHSKDICHQLAFQEVVKEIRDLAIDIIWPPASPWKFQSTIIHWSCLHTTCSCPWVPLLPILPRPLKRHFKHGNVRWLYSQDAHSDSYVQMCVKVHNRCFRISYTLALSATLFPLLARTHTGRARTYISSISTILPCHRKDRYTTTSMLMS